ncbi:hypothetical protein CC79DRAFT_1365273 [Sarocladium strictum]
MSSINDVKSDETYSDAILRVVSDSREDLDHFVIPTEPGRQSHAQLPILDDSNAPSIIGLGRLRHLPFEIMLPIVVRLDLQSALSFGQAGRATRWLLASVPEYRRLHDLAPACLWAMHRTRLAKHVDIATLYSTLTTKECFFCGSFGGFIFLVAAARCCFVCLSLQPSCKIYPLRHLRIRLGGSHPVAIRKRYRVFQCLPEVCDSGENWGKLAGLSTDRFVRTTSSSAYMLGQFRYMDQDYRKYRRSASARLPYLDMGTGEVQSGVSCKGCRMHPGEDRHGNEDKFSDRQKLYSRQELLQHFHGCKYAKELLASAK